MADEEASYSQEDFETWKAHPCTQALLKKLRAELVPTQLAVNAFASESPDPKVRGAFNRLLAIQQQIQALEGT